MQQQRFHFSTEFIIPSAGFGNKRNTLEGLLFQSRMVKRLDLLPTFWIHRVPVGCLTIILQSSSGCDGCWSAINCHNGSALLLGAALHSERAYVLVMSGGQGGSRRNSLSSVHFVGSSFPSFPAGSSYPVRSQLDHLTGCITP